MTYFTLMFFVLGALFSSCRLNDPAPAIPEEQFIRFYADLLTAQSGTPVPKPDTVAFKRRIDSLYHAYNLDTVAVRKTIAYYNRDILRGKEFYEKVIKRLESTARAEELADSTRKKW